MPSPPRRRGRRKTPPKSGNAGMYVFAAALSAISIAIIGIIIWVYINAPAAVDRDKVTGCPQGGPNKAHFILVDTTDTLPPITREQMIQKLSALMRATRKNELLELRTIDASSSDGTTHFAMCNPGDGSDEDIATGNPEKSRKRWQSEFASPFEAILPDVLSGEPGDASPILETLQSIAVERIAELRRNSISVELHIVSDMRQHSDAFSHYKSSLSYEEFKTSRAYRNLRTDLGGALVFINYVQRQTPRIDERKHLQFWSDWANDNGAMLEAVERLQGEN